MDSISDYIYRGTRPKPMAVPSPKRISTPAGQRLSTILENQNATAAAAAQQPTNRSPDQRINIGTPPRASEEKKPPSYSSQQGAITDAERARFAQAPKGLRDRLSRRGGWKRLGLIVGLVLLVVIALAVGLGVGLGMDDDSDDSSSNHDGNSGSDQSPEPFPAGSWLFDAFLLDVATDCTSNDLTWTCYPYRDYSESPSGSHTSFNWIIQSPPSGQHQFTISSPENSLAPVFRNQPLQVANPNTPEEYYSFSIPNMRKKVIPSQSLTGNNNLANCIYNSTTFSAKLFTQKPPTLSAQGGDSSGHAALSHSTSNPLKTWKHAVEVDQLSPDPPQCYQIRDGKLGPRIKLPPPSSSTKCRCTYKNFAS